MKGIVALLFAALPITAFGQQVPGTPSSQRSPINLDYARAYFAELREIGVADAGKMWGRPLDGPMLFADPVTRSVAANMPDLGGALRGQDGVWTGTLPAAVNVANTSVDWSGRRWTMVMWPVSDSRYARRRLLVHESFHRIQSDLGLPASDRFNAHLATPEGRIWTRLEWRALTEALLRDGPARRRALEDALIFRARRRTLFPGAAEDERLLVLNEGLAEYTGYALSGLPRTALYDRISVQLAQYEQLDNFARSFAYASGPAYALLLDAVAIPWRRRLRATSDLAAMAGAAYRISRVDAAAADSRSAAYTPARMMAEEREREARRVAAEQRLRARFIDGPTLTIPVAGKFSYSFDPNGAVPLQGVGTVFESSRVTDEWGVLEVSSGGVLMRRLDGPITSVAVPAPAGEAAPSRGEGWNLQLAPGWSIVPGERKGSWVLRRGED